MTIANSLNSSFKSVQVLTTGTAATYTKPTNINNILVECVGGGGGGGGVTGGITGGAAGGGGGAGGYCRKLIINAASTYTYTVGALGAGGTAGANDGTGGGNTTFDTLTANGGAGGKGSANAASPAVGGLGGAGGTATGGDFNIQGSSGQQGAHPIGIAIGGAGGKAIYTNPGVEAVVSAAGSNGNIALSNGGCGGSGATVDRTNTNFAGGNGGSGVIIVWEFS